MINSSRSSIHTSTSNTVYVGLSGGVDSAVSAALLQQSGYSVVGAFIKIAVQGYPCTAGEDRISAMRVAAHLKIPFVEVDLSKEYTTKVFEHAIAEFRAGRTPNPDALCNREIKFGIFFDWCLGQGADMVATGHYAQTKDGLLYMGADPEKDQSYFLWAVPHQHLKRTLFPIGHLHKHDVRALAKKFGLPNADRPDSQGLCFLGPISIADMLARELAPVSGDVLDETGSVVGTHRGAALYTMGQRHGFELTAHSAHTEPHFVIGKDIKSNTITVSSNKKAAGSKTTLTLRDSNWIGETPTACMARYRYRQPLIKATLNGDTVLLDEAHYVPEGQSVVLYDGARCCGGAVIAKSAIY